jgi:hypothetical protein
MRGRKRQETSSKTPGCKTIARDPTLCFRGQRRGALLCCPLAHPRRTRSHYSTSHEGVTCGARRLRPPFRSDTTIMNSVLSSTSHPSLSRRGGTPSPRPLRWLALRPTLLRPFASKDTSIRRPSDGRHPLILAAKICSAAPKRVPQDRGVRASDSAATGSKAGRDRQPVRALAAHARARRANCRGLQTYGGHPGGNDLQAVRRNGQEQMLDAAPTS